MLFRDEIVFYDELVEQNVKSSIIYKLIDTLFCLIVILIQFIQKCHILIELRKLFLQLKN